MAWRISSASETSAIRGAAWPPAASISSAVWRTSASVWLSAPMRAPAFANSSVAALPIPDPAPVTSATLPASSIVNVSSGALWLGQPDGPCMSSPKWSEGDPDERGRVRLRVVAAWGDLSDLPAFVSGRERGRGGRPQRHHGPPRPPRLAGRGRALGLADLPLAHGGLRLRRGRLLRDRPAVWHDGRLRPAGRAGARARAQGDPGLRAQPHLRPTPLVPGQPFLARQSKARLVRVARSQAGRRAPEQLGER